MRRLQPLDRLLLGTLLPIWLICFGLHVREVARTGHAVPPVFAVPGRGADEYPRVGGLRPETFVADSGLQVGDRLLRVGTVDLRGAGYIDFYAAVLAQAGSNLSVPVEYERGGTRAQLDLHLSHPPIVWARIPGLVAIVVTCVLVLLRAPQAGQARRFFSAFMTLAITQTGFDGAAPVQTWASQLVFHLSGGLAAYLVLRWALQFPEEAAPAGRIAPAWALVPAVLWYALRVNFLAGAPLPTAMLPGLALGSEALIGVAFLGALTWNYRHAEPVGRRRIKWLLLGAYVGTVTGFGTEIVLLIDPHSPWITPLVALTTLAFPTMALGVLVGVVRYNLFDIDRLISATAAYSIVLVALVAGGMLAGPRLAAAVSAALGLDPFSVQLVLAIGVAAVLVPMQRPVHRWVDRLFFKDHVSFAQGVARLLHELRTCETSRSLLTRTGEALCDLLHPDACIVYARGGQEYAPVFVRGGPAATTFDVGSALVAALMQQPTPVVRERWTSRRRGQAESAFARAALETLSADLLVPVHQQTGLAAFICLGGKRSGDIYTPTELTQLAIVADALAQELTRFDAPLAPAFAAAARTEQPPSGPPVAFADGRYHVRRFLGEGGKKRVYLGHDSRLDREVAIAVIKTEGLDEAGRARIRREARAMGRLGDHPHIVTVFDVGEENGQPYIVSQFMAGGSIEGLLQQAEKRRLPIERVVSLAAQLCGALEHAHTHAIVHRDLKPANVWLTADGIAKLGDFGLALALDRSRLTVEGMMVGTVTYMPPEQALGRAADARSDLYALGAMLYEMLTGRPPFLGDDAVAIISQHINTPPVAPSWHNPDVPRALEALVLRLLAKAPEDRPESAAAVQQALQAITASAARGEVPRAATEASNPLDRLAGGVFVGREPELDELRAGLEDALSGRGQLLLLVGEPGIGKTRTAEEFATYARLRKAQVLWGRCYEGEGAPAYWPWVQAIRAYVHDRDPRALLSELGSAAADIAQVVSEIRERLPGLPPPPDVAPEQARFRLFDGVTTFLRNASHNEAIVLVLDDLHWADRSSLLLLQFLARELRGARLLVIATYRDIDLGRQHPLAQTLGELAREQLTHRIVLRGLNEHDVSRFIEITAGLKAPEALVSTVYKETEGNPFFVNEIVRLLVSDGRLQHPETVKSWSVDIPQGVREVVSRRLDRLSADCNRVLTIASVIGREFSVELLERLSDLTHDRLVEVLDEAAAARVITELPRPVGRYSFAHALIRETLYGELTTTRRVPLHRQIGEALEGLYGANPEPHLAELAYHFFEAARGGDVDRAIAYAVRAGDRARALMAHEQAAHHYEMGLQALELHERRDAGRCRMLLMLSDTLWCAGEYDRAKQVALEAAELARRLGMAEELARAALCVGGRLIAFAALLPDETLIRLIEEALAAMGKGDSALRAELIGRLVEEITFSATYERRAQLCDEALGIARRLGDPLVLAHALRSTHWALWVAENTRARLAMADEMVALAERLGDRILLLEARSFRMWDFSDFGDMTAAHAEFALCAQLTEQSRVPYYRWVTAIARTFLAFASGRLVEIESLAQEALQLGQEAQNNNAAVVFGIHMALLLRAWQRNAEIEPFFTGLELYPLIAPNLRAARALWRLELGHHAEARTDLDELMSHLGELPRNLSWLFTIAYLSETSARLGASEHARVLYPLLQPFAGAHVTIGPVAPIGSAARYLALLASTLGRVDDAVLHFEAALAMNDRMGVIHELAVTQIDYAELLLARDLPGNRGKALELLNRALDISQTLGIKGIVERALALKLRTQGVVARAGHFKTSIDAVAAIAQREPADLRRHAAPDGTVTILFTDIEGLSTLTERLGDQRWVQLLRAHNAIVREHVAAHGGFEVKSQGDGFMLAFQSARRALQCAIAMQRAFATYSARYPDAALRVRIGLHAGEVIREADDFFGKNVILAARIAGQAQGGEILVSALLHELTESAGEFTFGESREIELKGLSGKRRVRALAWAA